MSDNKTPNRRKPDRRKSIHSRKTARTWPLLCGLLPALLLMAGCSVRLDPGRHHPQMPPGIFNSLLPLAQLRAPKKDTLKAFSPTVEGWVAQFHEHLIEQDDLLTPSNLSTADSLRWVHYDDIAGFQQNLLLYHLRALPWDTNGKPVDVVVYLAIHYDKDTVIHTGPLYFGEVNKLDGYISFLYELTLKKHGNQYRLFPKKKLSRLKALQLNQFSMHLLFLADELKTKDGIDWWQRRRDTTINVKKMISYDANKIGGKMPIVFNIAEVMRGDSAIHFIRIK